MWYSVPYLNRMLTADTIVPNPSNPQSFNRYSYVHNNPINYNDPTGHYLESAWDAASLGMGIYSLRQNIKEGNVGWAIADGVGIIVDAAALATPLVPGGVGAAIKATRTVDTAVETVQAVSNAGEVYAIVKYSDEAADAVKSAAQIRNTPGTATGGHSLKNITGQWLRGSHGNAGKVPGQIAEELGGRSFNNFDEFREAFWKAVSNDPELAGQFNKSNRTRMEKGLAPIAPESQHLGGQMSYQLHHKTPINQGGDVYNLDNIEVVTPRFHQEVLDKSYHYGYGR